MKPHITPGSNGRSFRLGYLIFISVVGAIGGFLFGYDTAVISGTISQVTQQFHLTTSGEGWYVGCALLGSIIGVMFAGIISDIIGRKKAMILSAILFTVSAAGCAVSPSFDWLVIYRIIGGAGIGVASIVCPLYISELAIARYRGRLVSLYQLAVTVGFLGAYLANYIINNHADTVLASGNYTDSMADMIFVTESWRGMLGMETLPALIFFLIIFFIPESPRWLISRQLTGRAEGILSRIYTSTQLISQEIKATAEVCNNDKGTQWSLLRKKGTMKAVLIGAAIAMLGQFMGVNAVLYYGPTIFEDAGLSSGDSLLYQFGIGIINTLTTVLALCIIDKVGRKALVYWGVSGMIISLVLIAAYFLWGHALGIPSIVLLAFFLMYIFCCAVSICAVVFVILSEMYPTRIRGLAMSIAGLSLWIGTFLIGQLTPWLLANLTPAGTFILFAFMCIPYILIMWKLVPETTGKTLEQIERHWES